MNARPELSTVRAIDDCLADGPLLDPAAARKIILGDVGEIVGDETLPLGKLLGRVASADICSAVSLPRFDNSAVDGFGLHVADLQRHAPLSLSIVGRAAAGHATEAKLEPGETLRILTGARIPDGVVAVILEERTTRSAADVTLHFIPQMGANIRGRGEDVSSGTMIVPKGTVLDARHLAILAASGNARISVKRRLRVGVLSTGDELVEPMVETGPTGIVDTNRPMLLALLGSPSLHVVDLGIIPDDRDAIANALSGAASHLDLLITSGGVAGSDADHLEPALRASGGSCKSLKLALRPGKPIARGLIGDMHVVGLPGNPVAALVNFLLFVRPLTQRLLGAAETEREGIVARTGETFFHKPGRTEFLPACIASRNLQGFPILRKLGRGGSARLLPLVHADGLAELDPDAGSLDEGSAVRFHPFSTSFAI
ncbi:MAG TPA: gephyrin-like molybdotransferase Glp [Pseudolabrys sp.]|nr:gephyrin-like molybdotransferase Glp [Pseudolabrys sp.]